MDLGKIKRDVLSEIERERKFTQEDLQGVIANQLIGYEQKILKLKELIEKLVNIDAVANATNNIFVETPTQQEQKPQQQKSSTSDDEPQDVVNALNQSHSE